MYLGQNRLIPSSNDMKISTSYTWLLAVGMAAGLAGCNSAMQAYKKGVHYYDAGEYNLALAQFEKANKGDLDPKRVNYYLGESYRLSNRFAESAPYYQKAIDAGTIEPDVRFHYAYALKAQGRYPEALQQLQQYVDGKPSGKVFADKARREIETLKAIDIIASKKTPYEIKNMGGLNTAGAEFSPMARNGELIFTASRKDQIYKNNGQPMLGLYKIKLGQNPDETGNSAQVFSNTVFQSDVNEGTPTFSKDGKVMVFARGNNGKKKGGLDVDLFVSRQDANGAWGAPIRLPVSDSTAWDGSPAFSADDSLRVDLGGRRILNNGIDIYRTNIDASGRFSRPVNMGRDINTPGDEMFPYVGSDGKLYFASDGHPGLGKLDIFVATRSQGVIRVENLGQPINSPADDFGLMFFDDGQGYFASNRTGGKGDDDIYFINDTSVQEDSTTIVKNTPPAGAPKIVHYFLAGTVSAKEEAPVLLDSVRVRIFDESTGEAIAEGTTGKPGTFGKYPLQEGKDYSILAERRGYLAKREPFTMQGRRIPEIFLKKAETDTTFTVDLLLDRLELNKTFVLENIYYDYDKFNIRVDAALELDKLVTIMKDNPTLKIELGSHTDVRGRDAYNQQLSQNRAKSAVDYIISKGIDAERITAKGYGETELIVKDAKTEEEHQRNRRTEFKILEY